MAKKIGKTLLTHCVVGVGEALVHPVSHEHPGVVKGPLNYLVVVLLQLLRGLENEKGVKVVGLECQHLLDIIYSILYCLQSFWSSNRNTGTYIIQQ